MGILRSEDMKAGTLVIPDDRAKHYIEVVGHHCNMQFEDMNSRDCRRPYKRYIQRVDEMERMIRYLTDEIGKIPLAQIQATNVDDFLANAGEYKLDELEGSIKKCHGDLAKMKEHNAELLQQRNAAVEQLQVVEFATSRPTFSSKYFAGDSDDEKTPEDEQALFNSQRSPRSRTGGFVGCLAGVIPQADQDRFVRTLFRAAHGNAYTDLHLIDTPIVDPKTGKPISKSVFAVYYQDKEGAHNMAVKVKKICSSYGANMYDWPPSQEEAQATITRLMVKVKDQDASLQGYERVMLDEVQQLTESPRGLEGNSRIEEWRLFCAKEKASYATLNLFEGDNMLRAHCWYPKSDEESIRLLLAAQTSGTDGVSAMLVSNHGSMQLSPPTFIRTNDYTEPYQLLVNTYGLPRYHEANPMPLTLVTFPFLFGVMFGDVGHGLMLMSVGLLAIFAGDKIRNTVPTLHWARYMIFTMGCFAIWMGFLYNDLFSVGFNFFGSRWEHVDSGKANELHYRPAYDTRNEGGLGPYPFGLDPAWHGASNELIYLNSLKMKMSVILGVLQMTAGLGLRWMNSYYEGNYVDMLCECLPMTVFMVSFFGFMDFMILYKWVTPMSNPPSIINSMIAMGMFQEDKAAMFGPEVPYYLMVAAVLSVPVMLIPKPLMIIMSKNQKDPGSGGFPAARQSAQSLDEESLSSSFKDDEDESHDTGDIIIHQIIETIEYVLGTVSHTASYLRLWALSLAHQQLSMVFFQKTLLAAMYFSFPVNVLVITLMFTLWFAITCGILLGMDVLECFLHTLRLHWVEFQSKFYRADGHAFAPYRHRQVLLDRSQ